MFKKNKIKNASLEIRIKINKTNNKKTKTKFKALFPSQT